MLRNELPKPLSELYGEEGLAFGSGVSQRPPTVNERVWVVG